VYWLRSENTSSEHVIFLHARIKGAMTRASLAATFHEGINRI
jgi:hypothetical protein